MNIAYIQSAMLVWARKKAGVDITELATSQVSAEKIRTWESGKSFPTEAQAETLAAKLGIPLAMLYMAEPPKSTDIKIPDLRTLNGQTLAHPSRDFQRVLLDTATRQDWCRSDRQEMSFNPISFVGRFRIDDDPVLVAKDMCSILGLIPASRIGVKT